MPLRHCAACGREGEKREFFRVMRLADGTFLPDATGKGGGRGAYLCRSRACIKRALRRQSLNRSFRQTVPREIYEELERNMPGE